MSKWPWTAILLLACLAMSAYTSNQLRKLAEAQADLAVSLAEVVEAQTEKTAGRCL